MLSDYSPDAVVVTPAGMVSPDGVFVGSGDPQAVQRADLQGQPAGQQDHADQVRECGDADTTIMRWVQFKGTPKELSGYDVFVVRGGKVVFQSVIVNAKK